jgi:hypothetical protein
MPYVSCEKCGLTTFSAAYWARVDYCTRCGAELPRRAPSPGTHSRPPAPRPREARRPGRPPPR